MLSAATQTDLLFVALCCYSTLGGLTCSHDNGCIIDMLAHIDLYMGVCLQPTHASSDTCSMVQMYPSVLPVQESFHVGNLTETHLIRFLPSHALMLHF